MQHYPIITLKPERDQAVKNRHPWIYSGAIKKSPDDLKNGDVAQIHDHDGQLLGYCHFSGQSTIAARIFHFTKDACEINDAFWQKKFHAALSYRKNSGLWQNADMTGIRLIYAEGDALPGIVCDVFGDVAVLQLGTDGARNLQKVLLAFLKSIGFEHVALKNKGACEWLLGGKEDARFLEHGMQFQADIVHGQKTGFFLDQRDNRHMVAYYAKGRHVLDAFCYSGGFSVAALCGGAKQVDSLDISADALKLVRANAILNGFTTKKHETIEKDCFDYLRDMPADKYDLIVLDPPAFAKNAHAIGQAARGYKDINLQAMRRIKSGGLLFTFSCSQHMSKDLFRKVIFSAAVDAGRTVRVMHQLSQPADHPIDICHLEGEYLKGLMLYVE